MADSKLRTVLRTQGSTQDLKDGTVTPREWTLDFEEVPVLIHAFRRMVRELAYDVCEMAFTTYLCAKAHGKPFTGLPIFLFRGFHHGAILTSASAGIHAPRELEGRRAGVNRGYTVTTGVWARGILQEEYGVDLNRVTWVLSGDEHVAEYRPPGNVVPVGEGGDVPEMVATGELAAGVGIAPDHPGVVPLIADPEETAFEALRQGGLYPINHLVVVRDEVLAASPGLAEDLFAAFAQAKDHYVERLRAGAPGLTGPVDRVYRRVMDITGADPLPYGIAPNRDMIERLIRHAVSQRILEQPFAVEDLFPPSTHHLTA